VSIQELRTQFAQRAGTLAEQFAHIVAADPVEGPIRYRVELTLPDVLSTGGGRRSVQPLRLVPIHGGAAIVIGSVDQVEMTALLRSWDLLADQYARRFKGAPLPVDAIAYAHLIDRMDAFFRVHTMRVDRLDLDRPAIEPSVLRPAAEPERSGAPSPAWAAALVAAGAILGAAVTLLIR
jgi:hypothetical protein